ncbi:MAG: FAD-dependent oxidoreductase [Spirochaetes bacterium]|nr:FAD-dependent oxidoreductase [Spirochaetota bacterium]
MKKHSTVAWHREIPVRYECDVAVIGGGIAGTSAALAAARSGARVLIVEQFGVVGGNATVGGVAAFCGETGGQGEAFDAIVEALESFKAIEPYRPYPEADNRIFDHEILAFVLQELLLRRGVHMLLHTQIADVRESGGRVTECILSGPSGPEAVRANQFIDCTGEAKLVHLAGFETVQGRPGDGLQLPMSLMFFVRDANEKDIRVQVPDGWIEPIRNDDALPMTTIWPNGPRGRAIKIKIPKFDAGDTESLTAAEIQARRRMMQVLDYYQRVKKEPWLFDHCSPRIGIREGRRIAGEYTLTLEDVRAGRTFDDAIARGVYFLDGHKPDDDKRTYILSKDDLKVPPYQIPFRCLLPINSENVLAAGRCMSAEQLTLSSARVMTTCSMMGQAAGIAAALAVKRNCTLRALEYSDIRKTACGRNAIIDL